MFRKRLRKSAGKAFVAARFCSRFCIPGAGFQARGTRNEEPRNRTKEPRHRGTWERSAQRPQRQKRCFVRPRQLFERVLTPLRLRLRSVSLDVDEGHGQAAARVLGAAAGVVRRFPRSGIRGVTRVQRPVPTPEDVDVVIPPHAPTSVSHIE